MNFDTQSDALNSPPADLPLRPAGPAPPDDATRNPAGNRRPAAGDATRFSEPSQAGSVVQQVSETLDRLAELSELLGSEQGYEVPPLDYRLPEKFLLSVVIPVYNERETIVPLLRRVAAQPLPLEIIVVDDCSSDGTVDAVAPFEPAIRLIRKPRNQGKGAALRDGFAAATGHIIVVQDADLEYDPRDIPRVIAPIVRDRADVVYGSRFLNPDGDGDSRLHRLGNRLLTRASNAFTGLRLTDMETCYKAFRRPILKHLPLRQNRFGFEPEITAKLARRGYRFAEVPIGYQARSYAEGKKIGVGDAVNALYCIARYGLWD